jgi:hypothetical protein
MIYLWEIQRAISTLRRAGIEPDSFSVTAETAAEVENAALNVTSAVESDKVPVMTLRTHPMTLAGVPLRVRL